MNSVSQTIERVLDLAEQSRNELHGFSTEDNPDIRFKRVWRSYYKIEMAIALMRFSYEEFKIGKKREIRFSSKKDMERMSPGELRKIFEAINLKIEKAEMNIRAGDISKAVEIARQARDELKILVGSSSKNRLNTSNKRKQR